jgi:hypothetical protein
MAVEDLFQNRYGPKVIGKALLESRVAAITACILEMNAGLARENTAKLPRAAVSASPIAIC